MPSCSPLQRCELLDGGISACSVRDPYFRETWADVQRFSDEFLGPSWVRPIPVRCLPFPGASFGFSVSVVVPKLSHPGHSSLRLTYLLEVLPPVQLAPHAHAKPPLLRFCPLQRSTETGVRFSRRFQPPALSVLRVSHPLDVLLRLQPWPACFIRPALLGFHRIRTLASAFQPGQGDTRPSFLSKAFSLPVTSGSSPESSLTRRAGAPAKERFGDFTPGEGSKAAWRVPQSFDHREVGVSQGSEPRAPAFLRFAADRPHS
jgi:hypothetical protein